MDLNSKVSDLPKIGPFFARKFERLGIYTIENLFYHIPNKYLDFSSVIPIAKAKVGDTATIHAEFVSIKNIYTRRGIRMQIGSVKDTTGKISVVWFNQPFLIKTFYPGKLVSLSGKVELFSGRPAMITPEYEILDSFDKPTLHTGRLVPVYPETSGLSSKWIRTKIQNALAVVTINDYLPSAILKKYRQTDLKSSINFVHFPKNIEEAETGRERLAFNELLKLNLRSEARKISWRKNKIANKLKIDKSQVSQFINSLPFKLTPSQESASKEILSDLSAAVPMNRLLEGDVGSGKTVIAAIGAFAAFANGFQTIIMAPTQILANQHYETLKKMFSKYSLRISLLTSSVKKIEIGRSDIFVGTHSLIHQKINFDKVAFVIIDEQHRFGVEQRTHLVKKTGTPHVLTMTATPIPRTIALTTYGDLDLSVLKEMPKGRIKVTTWVVPEQKRIGAQEWIDKQIAQQKSQVFWVCPLIEASDKESMQDVRAVKVEYEKLKMTFPKRKLALLHGRLKHSEKEKILSDFKNGKVDILVTTPVVEVGIDIPNATIMVVEASERFGLAQLHQLRGRVGRGKAKSYCLLFSNFRSGNAYKRLKAMERLSSGFELAELDLAMRGPGEIFGTLQSGFPELKAASWSNYKLIKDTKDLAADILAHPQKYPILTKGLNSTLSN
jgi:ATP-dependent DNA helicase RecG